MGSLAKTSFCGAAHFSDVRASDPSGTPAQSRRGRKRTLLPAIMRAAMELFARWGFEKPTMDQVAESAGVRKATLYLYFDSKSALIDAVVAQWLRELPYRPVVHGLPLREQLIDIGLQLQKLAATPSAVSFSKWIGEVELRLTPQQLSAWRGRYTEFESHLANLLKQHCRCEICSRAARQLLLLTVGDLGFEDAALRLTDMSRIESAVDLILQAYPPCV
jgi:AcrR family transcriptional regulator